VVKLGITAVICYLGLVIVLLFLENFFLYHPLTAQNSWVEPPDPQVQDIELKSADGSRIHAWWYPREGAQGALLYCHGNAGNLSHRGGMVVGLSRGLGVSVLIFDYPGFGRSDGKPSEASCYAAADSAYDWLKERVPPANIILFGKSLGGGVAVELARRRPHRVLVLAKTFTSVPDIAQETFPFLPCQRLVRNRFESIDKIGQCTRPVFIAHGDCDSLIPCSHGEKLFAAANEPKQFLYMPGCDHNDPFSPDFLPKLREFLAAHAPLDETTTASPRN
jgi:fermentation-respiration switch protein FrsA (DUF1100 family)